MVTTFAAGNIVRLERNTTWTGWCISFVFGMNRVWIVSHVKLLAHTLHPLMAFVGVKRMVVEVAAILEQPLTEHAPSHTKTTRRYPRQYLVATSGNA